MGEQQEKGGGVVGKRAKPMQVGDTPRQVAKHLAGVTAARYCDHRTRRCRRSAVITAITVVQETREGAWTGPVHHDT